jgi:hypothetical protein
MNSQSKLTRFTTQQKRDRLLAVDYLNMKLFRNSTLHRIIEQTRDWNYRVPWLPYCPG